ncbi:MAG: moeA [Firmicutes bacterium]|nr:moeA [Bacillota bacterium]
MAIKLEVAREILINQAGPVVKEQIDLWECHQRVLAETVVAGTDFPPFDRSPLDGYALIAEEVFSATADRPVRLKVVDNIPAGSTPDKTIESGCAARIMTGAPLPDGATGVVRLEDTLTEEDEVVILAGVGVEKNICRCGEEIRTGETIVAAGSVINAGAMGVLALLGYARPWVYKKPRVFLLATGSEIVDVENPLTTLGHIRNSNSYMLAAQVREAGAEPVFGGRAKDQVSEIINKIQEADDCDVVVTTGGASVGDYDLIGKVYNTLGISVLFERVGMKPGMPVVAGVKKNKVYIGLSGNPAAAANAFEQLARPLLQKMGGQSQWSRPKTRAILSTAYIKSSGPVRFVWARLFSDRGKLFVQPLAHQGNGMQKSALWANSLIVIPEKSPPLEAGSEVEVLLLGPIVGED